MMPGIMIIIQQIELNISEVRPFGNKAIRNKIEFKVYTWPP
jgi:hypothetical protein